MMVLRGIMFARSHIRDKFDQVNAIHHNIYEIVGLKELSV